MATIYQQEVNMTTYFATALVDVLLVVLRIMVWFSHTFFHDIMKYKVYIQMSVSSNSSIT